MNDKKNYDKENPFVEKEELSEYAADQANGGNMETKAGAWFKIKADRPAWIPTEPISPPREP